MPSFLKREYDIRRQDIPDRERYRADAPFKPLYRTVGEVKLEDDEGAAP